MPKTAQVRWGLLRPGATVTSEPPEPDRKVVTVDHCGATVSVLFWDGTRELHSEESIARVRLLGPSGDPRSHG